MEALHIALYQNLDRVSSNLQLMLTREPSVKSAIKKPKVRLNADYTVIVVSLMLLIFLVKIAHAHLRQMSH